MTTSTTTKLTLANKEIVLDQYYRRVLSEKDLCEIIYCNPEVSVGDFAIGNPEKHNQALQINFSELDPVQQLESIAEDPNAWHKQNQDTWYMPGEYQNISDSDLVQLFVDLCSTDIEIERVKMEMAEFHSRGLFPLLKYILYLVNTMEENSVVWGIGRGSSVASYVLYLTGIHCVDSIKHDLDFYEFMR